MNRWQHLSEEEKQLVYDFMISRIKQEALAPDYHVSVKRLKQKFMVIYRMLEVDGHIGLAIWVGRNWDLVAKASKPKLVQRA